jgi:hypothetical protein
MSDLLQKIAIERDELRAQIDAIHRIVRQYKIAQGRMPGRRRLPYTEPVPLRGVFGVPPHTMMNGTVTAEEALQDIRGILRHS